MTSIELGPRQDRALHYEIEGYQREIGSLRYVAMHTRPEVAFAVSRLACSLANPSRQHQEEVDRVMLYHLIMIYKVLLSIVFK